MINTKFREIIHGIDILVTEKFVQNENIRIDTKYWMCIYQ